MGKGKRVQRLMRNGVGTLHTLKDGWTYLASVMDLHSKKIIGYDYGKSITTDLVITSLKNAHNLLPLH